MIQGWTSRGLSHRSAQCRPNSELEGSDQKGSRLDAQEIRGPDGGVIKFDIDPFRKRCLMEGLDDIGLTLAKGEAIEAFESRSRTERPWA
jgi:3-isopropylmalate dehydratase small subunit